MGYGPQDWDLLAGIYRPGADPRVWRHKACGERLEFPDDKHRCREGVVDAGPQPDEMVRLQQALDYAERKNTRLLLAGEHMAAMIRNGFDYADPPCDGPCNDAPCRLFRAARQWERAVNDTPTVTES
jgi:hypothetical protein